jgi:hypothetical protein
MSPVGLNDGESAIRAWKGGRRRQLNLQHATAAISAIGFEDPDAVTRQTGWELAAECLRRVIAVRIRTPSQHLRPRKHLLDSHLEDNVRMRANPNAVGGDIAK